MLLSLTLPLGLIIKRAFHRPEHKTYSLSNVLSCVSAFSSSTTPGVLQEECAHRPSYYPLRQPEQEGAQGVRTDLPVPSARPECAMAAATRARGRSGETPENPPGPAARSPRGPGAQLAPVRIEHQHAKIHLPANQYVHFTCCGCVSNSSCKLLGDLLLGCCALSPLAPLRRRSAEAFPRSPFV